MVGNRGHRNGHLGVENGSEPGKHLERLQAAYADASAGDNPPTEVFRIFDECDSLLRAQVACADGHTRIALLQTVFFDGDGEEPSQFWQEFRYESEDGNNG